MKAGFEHAFNQADAPEQRYEAGNRATKGE